MRIDLLRPESVALALALTLSVSLTLPGYGNGDPARSATPEAAPAAPTLPEALAPGARREGTEAQAREARSAPATARRAGEAATRSGAHP